MLMPRVGQEVSVTVKNSFELLRSWFRSQPKTTTYTGRVVKPFKWLSHDEFCMTTGEPKLPIRVINMKHVVELDGVKGEYKPNAPKVVTVKGSKGDEYTVTINNQRSSCTCVGYSFRKTCSHIKTVEEQLGKSL